MISYTDDTPIPFGSHKGTKLANLTPQYLLFLFDQSWIKDWPSLYDYIKKNKSTLELENKLNKKMNNR